MEKTMNVLRGLPLLLLLAVHCIAQQNSAEPSPQSIESLRKEGPAKFAELQQRADQASGAECAKLSMRAARQALESADRLFLSGNAQAAHDAVDVSMHYAQRAVECTLESRKHQKAAEIELRGLIRRMNDVARMLDSEERQQLTDALAELEKERDRLLQAIFGPAAAGPKEQPR